MSSAVATCLPPRCWSRGDHPAGRSSSRAARGLPAQTRIRDLGLVTLLPGLIDAHTHLMMSGRA